MATPLSRFSGLVLLLVLFTGTALAQETIYVDTGGNDAFSGTQSEPVRTINEAISRAEADSNIEVISIEAGFYGEDLVLDDDLEQNVTFVARQDLTTNATVVEINSITNSADGITFGSEGGVSSFEVDASITLNAGDDGTSSFTAVEDDLLLADGGTVSRAVGADFNGDLDFGGAVTVNYTGDGDITASGELPETLGSGSALNVNLASGTPTDPNTLTLAGQITLNGGDVDIANADVTIDGAGFLVTGTGVDLDGNGNVGDVTIQTGAAATLSSDAGDIANSGSLVVDADVTIGSIDNDGTLDFSGQTLTVLGDFDNSTNDVTAGSIYFAGTEDVTFTGGPNFNLTNLTIGNGTDAKTVTFIQDVEVDGDFIVNDNATADLQGTFITLDGAVGTGATSDGEIVSTTGAVIFTEGGQELRGTGQFSNIFIATNGTGLIVAPAGTDADFTGELTLQNGGLAVEGDVSPMMLEGGEMPSVFINVAGPSTNLALLPGGTFNADQAAFDLTYDGDGSDTSGAEFDTEYISDLLVNVTGTVTASGADEDGTIDGTVTIQDGVLVTDANITIEEGLFVAADGTLDSTTGVITLNANSNVFGIVDGSLILEDDVTVTGSNDVDDPSEIENVEVADGASATITGVNGVDGTITFASATGSALALGIYDDPATPDLDGSVAGDITLQGNTLTLLTDIAADGDVMVDDGTLALGDNDLRLTSDLAALMADAEGMVTAGEGAVVFANTNQEIDVNGVEIANVMLDGSGDVDVNSDLVITMMFTQDDAGNSLNAGANAVTISGTANIAGGTFFTGDELTVENLTVNLDADATVGGALTQDGALTLVGADGEDLTVTGLFNQVSGELALGGSDLVLTMGGLAYDFDAGAVTAGDGAIVFEGTAQQSYDLAAALTIPNLVINNDAGVTDADADGDDEDLTIGELLVLMDGELDTADETDADADEDVILASGVTVIRWDGSIETAPEFPGDGSLTIQYGDEDMVAARTTTTGPELPNEVARLLAYDNVVLDQVVTVNEEFLVAADFDDDANTAPDTRVILADLAELILSGNADIIDGDADQELEFLGMYDLTYRDYNAEETSQELTDSVRTLTIDQGDTANDTIDLDRNATVVNLVVIAGTFDFDGFRLNVEEDVTLAAVGSLINDGGADAALAFTGEMSSTVTLAGDFNVPDGLDLVIAKDQLMMGDSALVYVMVNNGSILFDADEADDETLVLDQGILMVDEDEFVQLDHANDLTATTRRDRGQGFLFEGESSSLFPMSWIASEVRKNIASISATDQDPGRVEFPVGDSLYAEYVLDFEAYQDQEFGQRTIGVEYIDTRPGGSNFPETGGLVSADFFWRVTSDVSLSSQTQFNVEARNDAYEVVSSEEIDALRLLRRQADDVSNPYTVVGNAYDNFVLDPTPADPISGDEEPVIVALNASAGFGPQGTVFTYGVEGEAPPDATVQVQVIHAAPSAPSPVDVYVNGQLVADDVSYKTATPYIGFEIEGTQEIAVAIAPGTSTSANDAVYSDTLEVMEGASYVLIAADDGVDGTEDALDVIVKMTDGPSTGNDQVEVITAHVIPGGPAIDAVVTETTAFLAQNLAYGEVSDGEMIDATDLSISIVPAGESDDPDTRILGRTFEFGVSAGERVVMIAGGLLDAPETQPTRQEDLYVVRPNGELVPFGAVDNEEGAATTPTAFRLNGVYPNPFNARAQVSFDLPEAANVELNVFDVLGRKVMTVEETMTAGAAQSIAVEANALTSGVYVYQLNVEMGKATHVESGRMTVVR